MISAWRTPRPLAYDPGYGPLVTTRVRIATWNLWGRYGPWEARLPVIIENLGAINADILALARSVGGRHAQPGRRDRRRARLHRAGVRGEPRTRRRPLGQRGDLPLADHPARSAQPARAGARTTRSTKKARSACACSPRSTGHAGRSRCSARTSAGPTTTARSARSRSPRSAASCARRGPRPFPAVLCGDLNADPTQRRDPHAHRPRRVAGASRRVPRRVGGRRQRRAGLHVVERQPVRGGRRSTSTAASTT